MTIRDDGAFDEATVHRRRFMRNAGLGIGATALLTPICYILWRSRGARLQVTRRMRKGDSAPPRRISSISNATVSRRSTSDQAPPLASPALVKQYVSEEGITSFIPSMEDITQSNVYLAVKAFTLATLAVSTVAGTIGLCLIWKWDLQSMSDLNQKLHQAIGSLLPNHSSTINRPFKPSHSDIEAGGSELSALLQSFSDETVESWTWEEAKGRMHEAYQRGGPVSWTAAMVREMELGNQHEIRKEQHSKGAGPP